MLKQYFENRRKREENKKVNKRVVHRSIQETTNASHVDSTLNTINAINIASSDSSGRCDSHSSDYNSYSSDSGGSSSSCD